MKKFVIPAAILAIVGVIVAGVVILRPKDKAGLTATVGKKQIINALPFSERPFVALVPHESNKLLTLFFDKPGKGTNVSLDIEYLSGNALKGGRTSVTDLTKLPYTTAFLLGSCSSGGKCSFDTDITTGTLKTKLEIGEELHVLKSNFVFVTADGSVTSDQKLGFTPKGKLSGPMIVGQTHGYLGEISEEVAAEPVAITATNDDKVSGTLSVYAKEATKLVYFDGEKYQELKAVMKDDRWVVELSLVPWSKTVEITRDDNKGAKEMTTLYLIGPIVPLK